MKKYFGLLLLFLIIIGVGLLLLINFNIIKLPGSIKAESISLSQNEIGIKLKKEYQLYSFIYPSKASGVKVIYESSNPDIIEVNNVTGYIKAKKLGTATVTAKLENDEKIIDSCLVYVLKENVLTEKLISNVKEVNLESGDTFQLKYQISPNNATVHDVEFVSSDKSIAYVNELGQIKGNNSGKAIISINEKTSGVKEDIIVNVYGEENKKTVKERIEVDTDDVTLNIGGSYELSVKVLPEEANQELTYRSLNDSIATISEDGVIEGKGKGETKVIIRSVTSEEKVVKVKVQEEVVKLEKIRASERNITIKEGEKKKINITFSPNNATNKGINWISENNEVATVSNGTIYGVSSGNTIIKAISEDGNYEEKIAVKVNKIESSISLKDIKLDKTNVNIKVGESANIKVSYEPENATNKNISWTSSNESIATVKNGLIIGKRQGSCEIYVKSISSGITKTIKVNVSNIEVSKIELDESNITIEVGESDILVKTIIPSNATNKNVTWVSSDTSIVRVNNGTITGEKVGTAIVTARTSNGKEAKCSVKVTAKKTVIEEVEVKKIVLDKESATLNEGEKVKLTATIVPSNAKNKQVTWTSSDTSKATVSNGEVIAKKGGNVTITAKSSNGYTATCKITILTKTVEVTGIKVDKTSLTLENGDKAIINGIISPSNATDKKISWTSSNTNVVIVDQNGNVTTKGVGTATVTAKSSNGLTATCSVTVKEKTIEVTKVSLDKTSISMQVGDKAILKATISPTNATNKTVTWASSDTKIVTVDQKGNITAKGVGTATITVKTSNGKTATSKITVSKKGINVKVATFNIGMYRCGTNKNVRCETTPQSLASLIKSHKIDIIGIQEGTPEKSTNKLASELGYNTKSNYFYREPNNANAIISKYDFTSTKGYSLKSCREDREIDKAIIKINGVNISFYVTHFSYQEECHDKHFASVVETIKSDPNPIILTGDYNVWYKTYYEKYFKPEGFEVAAYDTKLKTYMDAIYFIPKGHLKAVSNETIETYGTYTDHNLVTAVINVY